MKTISAVLAFVLAAGIAGVAQKPEPADQGQERALVPLQIQIVLSRFKSEKKISSLPYILGVTANEPRGTTSLRLGVQVPIQSGAGYNYREVGTNIDCTAQSTGPDRYKLMLVVEDSSIHLEAKGTEPAGVTSAATAPAFRTFKSNSVVLLRDGQTAQYTSAVDPFSGEVMKIDVTLNVMK